jgi:hypothetical protein
VLFLVSFFVVIFVTQSMHCNLLTQLLPPSPDDCCFAPSTLLQFLLWLFHFSFDSSISLSTLPFRLFNFHFDSSISFSTLQFPFWLFNIPFDSSISLSTLPLPFRLFHFPFDSSTSLSTLWCYYTTMNASDTTSSRIKYTRKNTTEKYPERIAPKYYPKIILEKRYFLYCDLYVLATRYR